MMKSELLEMRERHIQEEETLRQTCKHYPSYLKKKLDHSCVGAGSCYPSVSIICRNCGTSKIIFDLDAKKRKTVKKTLKRQGFRDERLDCYTHYDDDLK